MIAAEGALKLLAYLAEHASAPIAEYRQAFADMMSGEDDADHCDERRDEASYLVLEILEAVLQAARDAAILPAVEVPGRTETDTPSDVV